MTQAHLPKTLFSKGGVTFRVCETHRFKTARLSLYAILPAHKVESPLSTLLFGILRRGSEAYPRLALLNRRLDELYGTTLTIRNYLHGDNQVLSFTAELLEEEFLLPADRGVMDLLGGTMELFAELLLRPLTDPAGLLREEAVEREKQTLCDTLRADRNDTRTYAANRLRELTCPAEPYGLPLGGTPEEVETITPAAVTAHWRRLLAEGRYEVLYVGRARPETLRAAWDKSFGDFCPIPRPVAPATAHIPPVTPRRVVEELAVSQGKLSMGWACGEVCLTPAEGVTAADYRVFNELFGVMQSSLLFRRVREELGLCYYCESTLDMTKGILTVSCGIRPDRVDEAEAAICACLAAICDGETDPADVELAKLSLENSCRQQADSQGGLEAHCFGRVMDELAGVPTREDTAAALAAIRAVTPEGVARAARRFVPDTVFFLKGTAPGEDEEEDGYDD